MMVKMFQNVCEFIDCELGGIGDFFGLNKF